MSLRTKFMIGSNSVNVVQMNEDTVLDNLPAKVYTLSHDQLTGFYLSITKDALQLPEKIYGNSLRRVDKCIHSYSTRPMSTGILMTGDKGTGKTLLMSLLANKVIKDLDIPVILIRSAYAGDQFISFIESIGECCLVFDEFGKLYHSGNRHNDGDNVNQDALLSLMDGLDKTKRMIIMTENSEFDVSEFLLNRPSRVYYHFRYKKLDESSIVDYCADFNVGIPFTKDIVELSRRSRIFSFDMLQCIVEEHLRFDSTLDEVVDDLNIDIKQEDETNMEIVKIFNKETEKELRLPATQSRIVKKPIFDYIYVHYIDSESVGEDGVEAPDVSKTVKSGHNRKLRKNKDEESISSVYVSSEDLAYESTGNLVYETENGITIVAKEMPAVTYQYQKYF